MSHTIFRWIGAVIILPLFLSCDRDTEPDGPNLVDRFGPFTVLENLDANREEVDFSQGQIVTFSAQFNKNVDWVITIVGQESGAEKVIEGFNREIDASVATWDGGSSGLPFFRTETALAFLTVPQEDTSFVDTVAIDLLGTKVYQGNVFADFEEPASAADLFVGNFEFELTNNIGRQSDIIPPAQGEFYLLLEGTDDVVRNFFVGLIRVNASINDVTYVEVPTTIPDQCYFNFFLYNDGRPHGIAVIQFAFDSNDSGAYEDGIDALFQLDGDFPLNFEGWRQYNHTMADVGMTAEQLEKIVAIRVLLISDDNAQPTPPLEVQFGIDFMVFTQGQPLQL